MTEPLIGTSEGATIANWLARLGIPMGVRAEGATAWTSVLSSFLARSHADLGQFDEAWRRIDEALSAVEQTGESWFEADVHRTAGEIALLPPERDMAKAQGYFERALQVARTQKARSLELRAATSLARLHRDQGKPSQARELLAPIYGRFTEGFETRDLKEAKALLDELEPPERR